MLRLKTRMSQIFSSDSVSVINTETNTVVKNLPVGNGPVGIVTNSICTSAYVANSGNSDISVINLRTNVVNNFAPAEVFSPNALALSPDNSTLYVDTVNGGGVVVLDASSLSVITTVPIGDSAEDMAINLDGSKLFVTSSNDYFVIDTATYIIIDSVALPIPFDVKFFSLSPDGQTFYLLIDFQICLVRREY